MIDFFKCPSCGAVISENHCSCGWEGAYFLSSYSDSMCTNSSFDEEAIRGFAGWLISKGIIIDEDLIEEYLEQI